MSVRPIGQRAESPGHPQFSRRVALQAGAIGLLGLGMNHVHALRARAAEGAAPASTDTRGPVHPIAPQVRSVIYIFLSGGLSQLESFDLKPDAPEGIRGEFRPIATRTPGIDICEHLPRLAERSHLWALVRSLTHGSNDHSAGHHIMLTGRSDLPPGFNPESATTRRLAVDGRDRRCPDRPAQQLAPGSGPARAADPQHGSNHPRPVRRASWGRATTPGSSRPRRSTRRRMEPIRLTSSTTSSVPCPPERSASRRRAWDCPRTSRAPGSRVDSRCCNPSIANVPSWMSWENASHSTSIARRHSRS